MCEFLIAYVLLQVGFSAQFLDSGCSEAFVGSLSCAQHSCLAQSVCVIFWWVWKMRLWLRVVKYPLLWSVHRLQLLRKRANVVFKSVNVLFCESKRDRFFVVFAVCFGEKIGVCGASIFVNSASPTTAHTGLSASIFENRVHKSCVPHNTRSTHVYYQYRCTQIRLFLGQYLGGIFG